MTNLQVCIDRFLSEMEVLNFSQNTIKSKREILGWFKTYCNERDVDTVNNINLELLKLYQRHLFEYRKKNGEPLVISSQFNRLNVLQTFFRYLAKEKIIVSDPSVDIELPKLEKRLPQNIFDGDEVNLLLSMPDVNTDLGLRDMALMQTAFSSSIRRMEIRALKIFDIDFKDGLVNVVQGKGKADRVVPIGENALEWINKYLEDVRPKFVRGKEIETLFVTHRGGQLSLQTISYLVTKYIKMAELKKGGSCHQLRRCSSTIMARNKIPVVMLQGILGHECLATTSKYIELSVHDLKEAHGEHHHSN